MSELPCPFSLLGIEPDILYIAGKGSTIGTNAHTHTHTSSDGRLILNSSCISRFLRSQILGFLTLFLPTARPNQIRWNRGNESLPERAEAVGETLTLPGLVSADNGTYTCEAANKHGHARALYVLVVYGEGGACQTWGRGGLPDQRAKPVLRGRLRG